MLVAGEPTSRPLVVTKNCIFSRARGLGNCVLSEEMPAANDSNANQLAGAHDGIARRHLQREIALEEQPYAFQDLGVGGNRADVRHLLDAIGA